MAHRTRAEPRALLTLGPLTTHGRRRHSDRAARGTTSAARAPRRGRIGLRARRRTRPAPSGLDPVANDRGLTLAAADAEGGQAASGVAAPHLVQQGDEDPAAAGADRMSE